MNNLGLVLFACAVSGALSQTTIVIDKLGSYTKDTADAQCYTTGQYDFKTYAGAAATSSQCAAVPEITWAAVKELVKAHGTTNAMTDGFITALAASTDLASCVNTVGVLTAYDTCTSSGASDVAGAYCTPALQLAIKKRAGHAVKVCEYLERVRTTCRNCKLNACTSAFFNADLNTRKAFHTTTATDVSCYGIPKKMCTQFQADATAGTAKKVCQAMIDADTDLIGDPAVSDLKLIWDVTKTEPMWNAGCANTCADTTVPTAPTVPPCKATTGAAVTTTTTTVKSGAFRYGVSTLSLAALFTLV